jgi:hypothetical protein
MRCAGSTAIRDQINRGFEKRDCTKISEVFKKFSDYRVVTSSCFKRDLLGRYQSVRPYDFELLIPKHKLRESLQSLDVILYSKEEVEDLFYVMDLDDNKGLDEEEFGRALQASPHSISNIAPQGSAFRTSL